MAKSIVVLGGGESGTGAALLAQQKAYNVFLSDQGLIPERYKKELLHAGISFEEGGHSLEKIITADIIIKSPGIANDAPVVSAAITAGIEIIGELEFALRFAAGKVIMITGTNGKTTTTLLCHHILNSAGLDAGLAGNVGNSLSRLLLERSHAYYVLEVSSFQLDDMKLARADIGVLLNITPDHLNRYNHSFDSYAASKFQILRNTTKGDVFIYNAEDASISTLLDTYRTTARYVPVGFNAVPKEGIWSDSDQIYISDGQKTFHIQLNELPLRGKHNATNMMASIAVALALEISLDQIKAALKTFVNVPHRLEFVGEFKGVRFYNDSKATNVEAVWYALESFNEPIIWIAGGVDKGNDYRRIEDLVRKKVRVLIALGIDNHSLVHTFRGTVDEIYSTDSMYTAVKYAYNLAQKGDVVLLSPACSSFDLFRNYEERGNKFKEAVLGADQHLNQKAI
ncbi:MAG: UDP-N-acetylmuramoyl-L-alanine--D-glutamate ligase [Cyclobacteriaceae bacterium]|nr:UDP-N-acetylmuramoyl-L-alanine--D-glutamate ligase [Cyclobacteriaceae bacterium]